MNLNMTLLQQNSPTSETQDLPHTIDFDMTLSPQCSPTHKAQDLPPPRSSLMLFLPDADGHDQYGLSTQCQSNRIKEHVEQIGRVRWGPNHVQFIEREEREEDDEEGRSAVTWRMKRME
jgi:hypothetical protein